MNHEFPSPIVAQPSQAEPPPPLETVQPPAAPSPEQLRAADAVFVEHKDDSAAAGLLGMWSGALILNDMATEHFSDSVDEDEEEKKKPKPK